MPESCHTSSRKHHPGRSSTQPTHTANICHMTPPGTFYCFLSNQHHVHHTINRWMNWFWAVLSKGNTKRMRYCTFFRPWSKTTSHCSPVSPLLIPSARPHNDTTTTDHMTFNTPQMSTALLAKRPKCAVFCAVSHNSPSHSATSNFAVICGQYSTRLASWVQTAI